MDAPRTDRLAVASLWCSLAGFVTGVTAILGIAFGFVARHRIKQSEGGSKGLRLALAGILLGIAAAAWAVVVIEVAVRAADDAPINLARSELLPRSAFPHGWTGQGQELENDNANYFTSWFTWGQVQQLATCLHMSTANVQTDPAEAAGQEYASPDWAITATDTVDVYSSTAAAAADAIASGKNDAVTCQFSVASGGLRFAGDPDRGLSSRTRMIPRLGDNDSDVEVRYPYPVNSKDIFFDDYVTVQQGTSEANLMISTETTPPSARLILQLARAAAWRMTHH